MPKIHFNGKTYNDIAEMPATERQAYDQLMEIFRDEDQEGTPDIFQGDVVGNLIEVVKKTSGEPEKAAALEQMSTLMRARLSKGLAKLHALGLLTGHPELPKEWPFPSPEEKPSWEETEIRPSKPIIQTQSAIQEDTGPRWLLSIVIFVAVSFCLAGVVAFIIYNQGF